MAPELGAVSLDRDKLEKTILNLVFNALKFTPANGLVAVRVEKKDGQLVATVRDTGVGISAKNLPFVFDRFWQADNSSKRKYQGVGIGLSLVKELTEVQGGKVSVESEEGKGTVFTVSLPFVQAEAGAVPKQEEQPAVSEAISAAKPGRGQWNSNRRGMAGQSVSSRRTFSSNVTLAGCGAAGSKLTERDSSHAFGCG